MEWSTDDGYDNDSSKLLLLSPQSAKHRRVQQYCQKALDEVNFLSIQISRPIQVINTNNLQANSILLV